MKGPLTQHQWSNPCYQFEQDLRQGKISQHVDRNGLYTLNKFFFSCVQHFRRYQNGDNWVLSRDIKKGGWFFAPTLAAHFLCLWVLRDVAGRRLYGG